MHTGHTAGASAPTSTTTKTGPRYGLVAAWQRVAAKAQRDFPHVNFEIMGPPAAFVGYRTALENATQADVAREANVSEAAVSEALSRCSLRLEGPRHDLTLPRESVWAGLREIMANRGYCYRPAPVRRRRFSEHDWGQDRFESYAGIPADRVKGFRRFVAAQERRARFAVRSHFYAPPPMDYYSTAGAAGLLFAPLASEATGNFGRGEHLTGERGEAGFIYEAEDRPASDALAYADSEPAALRKPLDAPTLNKIRRMVKAGASTALVAARLGVPEAKVRIVTGNIGAGVKARA